MSNANPTSSESSEAPPSQPQSSAADPKEGSAPVVHDPYGHYQQYPPPPQQQHSYAGGQHPSHQMMVPPPVPTYEGGGHHHQPGPGGGNYGPPGGYEYYPHGYGRGGGSASQGGGGGYSHYPQPSHYHQHYYQGGFVPGPGGYGQYYYSDHPRQRHHPPSHLGDQNMPERRSPSGSRPESSAGKGSPSSQAETDRPPKGGGQAEGGDRTDRSEADQRKEKGQQIREGSRTPSSPPEGDRKGQQHRDGDVAKDKDPPQRPSSSRSSPLNDKGGAGARDPEEEGEAGQNRGGMELFVEAAATDASDAAPTGNSDETPSAPPKGMNGHGSSRKQRHEQLQPQSRESRGDSRSPSGEPTRVTPTPQRPSQPHQYPPQHYHHSAPHHEQQQYHQGYHGGYGYGNPYHGYPPPPNQHNSQGGGYQGYPPPYGPSGVTVGPYTAATANAYPYGQYPPPQQQHAYGYQYPMVTPPSHPGHSYHNKRHKSNDGCYHPIHQTASSSSAAASRATSSPSPTYSRKDKSLGLMCENFIAKYGSANSPPPGTGEGISIDGAASVLGVERRRIYDIINILESVEVVSRRCKNTYDWHGLGGLTRVFARMQREGVRLWREDAEGHGLIECVEGMSAGGDGNSGAKAPGDSGTQQPQPALSFDETSAPKEKSLGKLCRRFLQMFLVGHEVISLADASSKILGCANPDDFEAGMVGDSGANNNEIKKQEGKKPGEGKATRGLKTKVRRLYDIANVMVSVGVITKVSGGVSNSHKIKPSFRWGYKVGPRELQIVAKKEEAEKADEKGAPSPSEQMDGGDGGNKDAVKGSITMTMTKGGGAKDDVRNVTGGGAAWSSPLVRSGNHRKQNSGDSSSHAKDLLANINSRGGEDLASADRETKVKGKGALHCKSNEVDKELERKLITPEVTKVNGANNATAASQLRSVHV